MDTRGSGNKARGDIIQKMLDDAFLFAVVVEFCLHLSLAFIPSEVLCGRES